MVFGLPAETFDQDESHDKQHIALEYVVTVLSITAS